MRGLRTSAVALASLLAAVVMLTSPAAADGELEVDLPGGSPLFELDDLAPGAGGEERMVIRNATADPATYLVAIVDLVDDDNGCNRPEVAAGDTSCGGHGGELSRDLLVTIVDDRAQQLYSGSLRDLAAGAPVGASLGPGASTALTVGYRFDPASGNETQTDRVLFGIEVSLSHDVATSSVDESGATSDAEVAGVQVSRARSSITVVGAGALPRTGFDAAGAARAGVVLVTLGSFLVLARRSRRQR